VSLRVLTAHPRAEHTVRFDGRRSRDPDGRVTAYRWTFGDRQTSRRSAPGHVFVRPGRYRVALTVTDDEHRSTTVRRTVVVDG
jgi:microbial collagenase